MDGSIVNVGDFGFDILIGAGQVTHVRAGIGFDVEFSPGQGLSYSMAGEMAGRKRFYWSNPIFYVPPKLDPHRGLIGRLIEQVRQR